MNPVSEHARPPASFHRQMGNVRAAGTREPVAGGGGLLCCRFLLTGSANILTAPRIADSLTGRAQYLRLAPFSQGELRGFGRDSSRRRSPAIGRRSPARRWDQGPMRA